MNVVTLLWAPNKGSQPFSRAYTEIWVDRLYEAVRRNTTQAFDFTVFTDYWRDFAHNDEIYQIPLSTAHPGYANCIEPFKLDEPMMLVGLDTVITGNIDPFFDYCINATKMALPRDPYKPTQACNGVCLVPAGHSHIYYQWDGKANDMKWLREYPHEFIDDLFPGEIVSYKGEVQKNGLGKAKIVYFHGTPKMQDLLKQPWIRQHWEGISP